MKRINLIRKDTRKAFPEKWTLPEFFRKRTLKGTALLLVIVIAINAWQAMSVVRYRLGASAGRQEIKRLKTAIGDSQSVLEKIRDEAARVRVETERIENNINVLYAARQERHSFARLLKYLSESMPEDLWIEKLKLEKGLITINGTALTNTIVSDFMNMLDRSGFFTDTSFNYTEKKEIEKARLVNFEVTTKVIFTEIARNSGPLGDAQ